MENASKALVMAGGVLIGILILSLAVYLFIDFGTTAAEINGQNAEQQIVQFNSKFTSYESLKNDLGDWKITIYDIVTVIGYAKENNKYYEGEEGHEIIVKIGTTNVQEYTDVQIRNNLIRADQNAMSEAELPKYSCAVTNYYDNGRVHIIEFRKIE